MQNMISADCNLRIDLSVAVICTIENQKTAEGSWITTKYSFMTLSVFVKRFVSNRCNNFLP